MVERQGRDPDDHAFETAQRPQRRMVPNIPAIENFLKRGLGREFASGLKERDKKRTVETSSPPMSLSKKFEAMLLADINTREAKGKALD